MKVLVSAFIPGFTIEIMKDDDIPEGCQPWIAITIENEFIDEDTTEEMFMNKLKGRD